MGLFAHNVTLLFICIGFLAVQPEKGSGALTSIDLALRGHTIFLGRRRALEAVKFNDLHLKQSPAPVPSVSFDPNQSSERRVRRGADPIHNRSLPKN